MFKKPLLQFSSGRLQTGNMQLAVLKIFNSAKKKISPREQGYLGII
jgi:hypothetical protein